MSPLSGLCRLLLLLTQLSGNTPQSDRCEKTNPCNIAVQFDSNGNPSWQGPTVTVVPGDSVRIDLTSGGAFAKHSCTWKTSHKCGLFKLKTCEDTNIKEVSIDRITYVVDSKVLSNIPIQVLGASSDPNPTYTVKRPGILMLGRHEDSELPQSAKPTQDSVCTRVLLPTQLKFQVVVGER